ncbi:MAG: NAD(P)/FAD-dependent oxidoreductase [Jatrophihabitantaceae bacterium]
MCGRRCSLVGRGVSGRARLRGPSGRAGADRHTVRRPRGRRAPVRRGRHPGAGDRRSRRRGGGRSARRAGRGAGIARRPGGIDAAGARQRARARGTSEGAVGATGLRDELPDIPGLSERWAIGVLHCPYCHGYEVRDQPLAVIGQSPDAVQYAQIIRQWSGDVTLVIPAGTLSDTHRAQLSARNIDVVEGDVTRTRTENERLSGIEMNDGRFVPSAAVFVPSRLVPKNSLLIALGCAIDQDGWVATGPNGHTGVPGVWVAGNLANPRAQVITAAGEGSAAAIAINADLVDEDVRDATRPRRTCQPARLQCPDLDTR